MKKFGVFDLDGTVYRGTLTFDVVEELMMLPEFAAEKKEIEDAKRIWKERGSTEAYWVYNKTLLKEFDQFAVRVSTARLAAVARHVLDTKRLFRYAYTSALIGRLKAEGRTLIAISGSITDVVDPFARAVGFDIVVSSALEIVEGKYTGKRVSWTNKNKDQIVQNVVAEHGLTLEDSIGVGDTHRDIGMLSQVEHPIAFNPNAALYDAANKRGWKIVIERKNMVFELAKKGNGYVVESAHPSHEGPHQEHLH